MARERIAIIGSPRAGKTTLARTLGEALRLEVYSSDETIGMGWAAASREIARVIASARGIYEGVAVVRALRQLLGTVQPDERPIDQVIVLHEPCVPLTPGQAGMRKGCTTILLQIEPELLRRGVSVVHVWESDRGAAGDILPRKMDELLQRRPA